jgi:hypothetical protein
MYFKIVRPEESSSDPIVEDYIKSVSNPPFKVENIEDIDPTWKQCKSYSTVSFGESNHYDERMAFTEAMVGIAASAAAGALLGPVGFLTTLAISAVMVLSREQDVSGPWDSLNSEFGGEQADTITEYTQCVYDVYCEPHEEIDGTRTYTEHYVLKEVLKGSFAHPGGATEQKFWYWVDFQTNRPTVQPSTYLMVTPSKLELEANQVTTGRDVAGTTDAEPGEYPGSKSLSLIELTLERVDGVVKMGTKSGMVTKITYDPDHVYTFKELEILGVFPWAGGANSQLDPNRLNVNKNDLFILASEEDYDIALPAPAVKAAFNLYLLNGGKVSP